MKEQGQMLTELNQLLSSIHEVDVNLSIEQMPDKVVLLMGETRAGKTTLLYYLLGKPLIVETNNETGLMSLKPETEYMNAVIGNNYDSTTVYPNIPVLNQGEKCLIIDMPGFNDTRAFFRLLNIYIIQETIRKIKNVHVSMVIPLENLQGEALITALNNTCELLGTQLIKADRCVSFILTKIQDEESDKQLFQGVMEELKEEPLEGHISTLVSQYADINKYIFTNQQPRAEDGAELKEKIVSENHFFPIEQDPKKLLSNRYADIIIGKGNLQDFNTYIIKILKQIHQHMPTLIELFKEMLKYHHFALFQELLQEDFSDFSEDRARQTIKELASNIPITQINNMNLTLSLSTFESRKDELEAFVYKINPQLTQRDKQLKQYIGGFYQIVLASEFLQKQSSGIPKEFRKAVGQALKNIVIVLRTMFEINQTAVRQQLERFFNSETILKVKQTYNEFLDLTKIATGLSEIPEAQQLAMENQTFKDFVAQYNPSFSLPGQIVKIVKVNVYDKLKNNGWQNSIQKIVQSSHETMIETPKLVIKSVVPAAKTKLEDLVKKVESLPITQTSLEMILKGFKQTSQKRQSLSSKEQVVYLNRLWHKVVSMFEYVGLFQQAIMVALAIPDELAAQALIDVAIKFNQISTEFISEVLIPYHSSVTFNFALVEKLYNYLSIKAAALRQLISIEQQYVITLKKMRQMLTNRKGSSRLAQKRFNYAMVASLIQGQGREELLRRAESNLHKINTAKIYQKTLRNQIPAICQRQNDIVLA